MELGTRASMRSHVRNVVGSICIQYVSGGSTVATCQFAYLVELVEVAEDDGVIGYLREELFPHLPPAPLFFLPADLFLVGIGRALLVVAAEECVTAVYDILAIHPVIVIATAVLVYLLIFQVEVASPWAKGVRRDSGLVSQEIVAPFRSKCAGKSHE